MNSNTPTLYDRLGGVYAIVTTVLPSRSVTLTGSTAHSK
jgi:hypothetical protein